MPKLGERYARALVTGAGSGLGKAFTSALIDEGVQVWGTSRTPGSLRKSELFHSLQLDLSVEKNLQAWFEKQDEESGGFDLVINNAGFAALGEFEQTSREVLDEQMRVLFTGPLELASAAIARMREREHGCLANVSSMASDLHVPYLAAYNAAKAGLSAFSQSLMMESPKRPPWIVDFRPGDFNTPFNSNMRRHGKAGEIDRAWKRQEALMEKAPSAEWAAQDLISALGRFRHCTLYSGSFLQTSIAPLVFRLFPASFKRKILRRYFNLP